jgi:hypothetical protein
MDLSISGSEIEWQISCLVIKKPFSFLSGLEQHLISSSNFFSSNQINGFGIQLCSLRVFTVLEF